MATDGGPGKGPGEVSRSSIKDEDRGAMIVSLVSSCLKREVMER